MDRNACKRVQPEKLVAHKAGLAQPEKLVQTEKHKISKNVEQFQDQLRKSADLEKAAEVARIQERLNAEANRVMMERDRAVQHIVNAREAEAQRLLHQQEQMVLTIQQLEHDES